MCLCSVACFGKKMETDGIEMKIRNSNTEEIKRYERTIKLRNIVEDNTKEHDMEDNNTGQERCKELKHIAKIVVIQVIPLVALAVFSLLDLANTTRHLSATKIIQNRISTKALICNLILALQIERGISATYLSSSTDDSAVLQELVEAHGRSDIALQELRSWPVNGLFVANIGQFGSGDDFKTALDAHRFKVTSDWNSIYVVTNIQFYTSINNALMKIGLEESLDFDQSHFWSKIVAKDLLLYSSDLTGIRRALGAVHYQSCRLSPNLLEWFNKVSYQSEILLEEAYGYLPELKNQTMDLFNEGPDVLKIVAKMTEEISQNIDVCQKYGKTNAADMALQWFWNISYIIKTLDQIHDSTSMLIIEESEEFIHDAEINVIVHVII